MRKCTASDATTTEMASSHGASSASRERGARTHASRAVARAEGDDERFRPRDRTVPMTSDPGGERRQRLRAREVPPGAGAADNGTRAAMSREDDRRDGLDAEE